MKECRKKLYDAIDRWDIMEKEIAKSVVQSNKRLSMKEIERESKQAAKKSKGGRRQTVTAAVHLNQGRPRGWQASQSLEGSPSAIVYFF